VVRVHPLVGCARTISSVFLPLLADAMRLAFSKHSPHKEGWLFPAKLSTGPCGISKRI
jgi:hypothetical protein